PVLWVERARDLVSDIIQFPEQRADYAIDPVLEGFDDRLPRDVREMRDGVFERCPCITSLVFDQFPGQAQDRAREIGGICDLLLDSLPHVPDERFDPRPRL